MAIFKYLIVVLLVVSAHECARAKRKPRSLTLHGVVEIISSGKSILRELYDAWHVLLRNPDINIEGAFFRSKEHEIIGRITSVSRKLHHLDMDIQNIAGTTINTILHSFPKMIRLEIITNDLANMITQINLAQKQLEVYLIQGYKIKIDEEILPEDEIPESIVLMNSTRRKRSDDDWNKDGNWLIERHTLEDFATRAVSHAGDSISSMLGRIHEIIAPRKHGVLSRGLFRLVKESMAEVDSNVCNFNQSPQQLLYNLYNTVALTEIKGYAMIQYSLMLLKLYNKGNFTLERELRQKEYEERTSEKIQAVREAMRDADRSIYKCDPRFYVENDTYVRVTKLLQGYIENEVNFNSENTCRENCAYYTFTEVKGCYKEEFCKKQPQCKGKVISCQYIDSDMNICMSPKKSDRRYDWVRYENGKVLGKEAYCPSYNYHQVDSWWRYLFWHCSYCFCLCDDNSEKSDRSFNLRDVTSDIEQNKVITGIRIIKQNQIIHLQIQEGELLGRGMVNISSLSWKPVDNYKLSDHDVENGVDYHKMTWNERAIDLDDVTAPTDFSVTGVRFRKIGGHLNLQIRQTPIDFVTGRLGNESQSEWIGNDNTDGNLASSPRTKIPIQNPDIPTRGSVNVLDSKHDQFVFLQATDMDRDASQETVPYFDSQMLTSDGLMISGVGLIHRGRKNSGGFIAPKLITYDFSPHIMVQAPDDNLRYL